MKNKILILLLIIFAVQIIFRLYQYKDSYLTKFNSKYWQDRYLHSQWVIPNSKEAIGDDGLYAYAGWEYIHGRDPTTLNAEIPPFGKYLLGLTEVVFDNQNIFALLSGVLVLVSYFILNKIIFRDNLLAFLPVFLFSFDPLLYTQLRAPFLDLLYLGLLFLTFIFVYRKNFWLSSLFLGLMTATKASSSTFVLVAVAILVYLLYMKKAKELRKFLISLPVALIILLLTYSRFFLLGHSFHQFLSVQKWILNFYGSGAKGNAIAVWQILLTGKWPTWFGPVEAVAEWNILWPLSLVASVYYLYRVLSRRKLYKSVLFGFWIIIYLGFLVFVPVFPRYLLLLLPFMYNLAVWVLSKSMPRLLRLY